MNLHLNLVSGRNPHHIIEATVQGVGACDGPCDGARAAAFRRAVDQGHAQLDRLFENFTVIPSIDLKGGQVVRLLRGDMNRVTVYGGDPGRPRVVSRTRARRLSISSISTARLPAHREISRRSRKFARP